MSISQKEIQTLARLSRLEFSEEEQEKFIPDFEEIIAFADRINGEVVGDTSSIKEVAARTIAWEDLREDEVTDRLHHEKSTYKVEAQDGYFPVSRVVK